MNNTADIMTLEQENEQTPIATIQDAKIRELSQTFTSQRPSLKKEEIGGVFNVEAKRYEKELQDTYEKMRKEEKNGKRITEFSYITENNERRVETPKGEKTKHIPTKDLIRTFTTAPQTKQINMNPGLRVSHKQNKKHA